MGTTRERTSRIRIMAAEVPSIKDIGEQILFHPDEQVLFLKNAKDSMAVMLEDCPCNLH